MPFHPPETKPTDFPFSRAQISAGIRRYEKKHNIWVTNYWETPLILRPCTGKISGLVIEYSTLDGINWELLALKFPRGNNRAGLPSSGVRETNVYRWLRDLLPVLTPRLITASKSGKWLLMEAIPTGLQPPSYQKADIQLVIERAVDLHERFWRLEEDLKIFNWLSRPLLQEFNIYLQAARNAHRMITQRRFSKAILYHAQWLPTLEQLLDWMPKLARQLNKTPLTLIHGDFWLGNLELLTDQQVTLYDWQEVGIAPGLLDIVNLAYKTTWHYGKMAISPDEMFAIYRQKIQTATNYVYKDEDWQIHLHQVILWYFITNCLDQLAYATPMWFTNYGAKFEEIWLTQLQDSLAVLT
jgi:thiamine kinase-like enzyme